MKVKTTDKCKITNGKKSVLPWSKPLTHVYVNYN